MDRHIIYATTQSASGFHHYRVSPNFSWEWAQRGWARLDDVRRAQTPPLYVGGCPVKFFSVRAANDPNWPAEQHQHTILMKLSRGFVSIPLTGKEL